MTQAELHFDGRTYNADLDGPRLAGQLLRVFKVMADGKWRSYAEIAAEADVPEGTVGSRVRDLRKPKFGDFNILTQRIESGLWKHRLVLPA